MTPTLDIRLLGDFRLQAGDIPVTGVDSPRLQSFLAYLVFHRDAPQARSRLAFAFWLDSTEAQARTNLRKQVYHLRRALPDADRFLHADAKVIQWQPDAPFTVDVAEFEYALAAAEEADRTGDRLALRASLERAVALYSGDLLPSSYDEWVLSERERLRQRFIQALERLAALLEAQRDYQDAIRHTQRLLRYDPLYEAAYRRLMRLHALNGDRARAVRTFHACATVLQRELDVDPSATTREDYERLVMADVPQAPIRVREKPASALPLVGRDGEWQQLQAAWRAVSYGQSRLFLLSGEVGIGKTRLAEELLDWASRQGIPTAASRCYASGDGLAYAPVAGWLRGDALRGSLSDLELVWLKEVARLLPELLIDHPDLSPPGPLTEAWQRQRLFEALARALLRRRQLLLLLDDLQWCDRETLDWLPYLLRAVEAGPAEGQPTQLLILGTVRSEEAPDNGHLATLLRDLHRRRQVAELELDPLDEAHTIALAAGVAGGEIEPGLALDLYRETEGNPLFVVETVRAGRLAPQGQEAGLPAEDAGRERRWPLAPAVHEAILARLAQLSPEARELVSVAATIGRAFTFDVVLQATAPLADAASEEALVRALDELWRRRIVREQGADAYDFSHDKIREVAYQNLSAVRRRFLHRRLAQAFEAIHAPDLEAVSGQVAAHYERAGLPEEAAPYYERAAGAARRIYAIDAAIDYYRKALACLPGAEAAAPVGRAAQRWRLYEGLGRMLRRQARFVEAEEAFSGMRRAARAAGDAVAEARAWNRQSDVLGSRSLHRQSLETASRAEALARAADPGSAGAQIELAMALFARGWAFYKLGDANSALALGEQARELSAGLGPQAQHVSARSHNLLGVTYKMLGDYPRSLHHQEQALALFREVGDERRVAGMLSNLGETFRQRGDFGSAIELYQQALEAGQKIGDRDWEMAFRSNLGGAYVGLGNYPAAEAELRRTIEIAERAGEQGLSETYSFLADACVGQGKLDEALVAAQQALALGQASGHQLFAGIAWRALGRVAARLGEPVLAAAGMPGERYAAADCFAESLRILRELGAEAEEVHTIEVWAVADPGTLPDL